MPEKSLHVLIAKLTVVNSVGASFYEIGGYVGSKQITEIFVSSIYFTGDPFDHYCVYSNNEIIATINPLCPCIVEYV